MDPDDPRPPYLQVAEALRGLIRRGALAPGAQLPPGTALAQQHGVARMTVQNAIRVLRSEGLVVSWQGKGVFVRPQSHTAVGFASLASVALECADPDTLAAFYHQLLGWPIIGRHEDYADISDGDIIIRFARAEGYRPPAWPDTSAPKRYHLDLDVDDLPDAVDRCLQLGAQLPAFQPGGDQWTVLIDPAGHPFCLCRR